MVTLLPPLPAENEDPWFDKRQAFDLAVKNALETRLSEESMIIRDQILNQKIEDVEIESGSAYDKAEEAIDTVANSIVSVETEFAVSEDPDTPPTIGWGNVQPDPTPGFYIWTRTVTVKGDSSVHVSAPYKFVSGQEGPPGNDGRGVDSSVVHYQVGGSGTEAPEGTWLGYIPPVPAGQYLWTRLSILYTDLSSETIYTVAYQALDGSDGIGIETTTIRYNTSPSGVEVPSGEWVAVVPSVLPGYYLWTRTVIKHTDNSETTSYSVGRMGTDGEDGAPGDSAYLHVAYSSSADGSENFSVSDPSGRSYMGTYTDDEPADSPNYIDYDWVKIQGEVGVGISGVTVSYQAGNSGTTPPLGEWDEEIPVVNPGWWLWTQTLIQFSDSSTQITYTNARQGQNGSDGNDGVDGRGISSLQEQFYQSTSSTELVGGSWETSVPDWIDGRYIWTRTLIIYTDDTQNTTPEINTTGAKGLTGVSITDVDVMYYLSTSAIALVGGEWETEAPTWIDGRYMWSKTVTTFSDSTVTETSPVNLTGSKGATGNVGPAAITIDVGNEAAVIPTNVLGVTTTSHEIIIPFTAFQGEARLAATIAVSGLPSGITVDTNTPGTVSAAGSLKLFVASGTNLGNEQSGQFNLLLTTGGIPFPYTFNWSKAHQGAQGISGVAATNIVVGVDAVSIPTSPVGLTTSVHNIVVPFGAWLGDDRIAGAVVVSDLPPGITVADNTNATESADGSFKLVVAYGTNLGGNSFGQITFTFSANAKTIVRRFGWSKAPEGAPGDDGEDGEDGVSVTGVTRYFRLATSKPAEISGTPTTPSGWSTTEPQYTPGSTQDLYFVDKTDYSNGTRTYSLVSLSSTYAAAKAAHALAQTADGRITISANAPVVADGSGKPTGAIWYRRNGSGQFIGAWEWSGSAWSSRAIENAMIATLDAAKVNTGYLNAARIEANSLTTEKLTVTDMTNLINDSAYLYDRAEWRTNTANSVIGTPSGEPRYLEITTVSSGNNDTYNSAYIESKPGDEFWVEFEVWADPGNVNYSTVNLWISSTNASGNNLAWPKIHINPSELAAAPGTWLKVEGVVTLDHPDTAFSRIAFSISSGHGAGKKYRFRNAIVRRRFKGDMVVDGTLTARNLNSEEIMANEAFLEKLVAGMIYADTIHSWGQNLQLEANSTITLLATDNTNNKTRLNNHDSNLEGLDDRIDGVQEAVDDTIEDLGDAVTNVGVVDGKLTSTTSSVDNLATALVVDPTGVSIMEPGSPIALKMSNDKVAFEVLGTPTSTWTPDQMVVEKLKVTQILIGQTVITDNTTASRTTWGRL